MKCYNLPLLRSPVNSSSPNSAIWTRDGPMLMDRQGHLDFHARALLQFCSTISSQLPKAYGLEIDANSFLQAFRLRDTDNSLLFPCPWYHAPSGRVCISPDPGSPREQAKRAHYTDHYGHLARGIPCAPNVHPMLDKGECFLYIWVKSLICATKNPLPARGKRK